MIAIKKTIAGGAVALLALALAGCSGGAAGPADGDEVETIRLGVVPAETVEATLSSYSTFVSLFEEETGYEIEFFEATNVAPVIEATIAGDLDLVMLGPFAQVMARDNGAGITTVGPLVDSPWVHDNTSIGLTLADSGLSSVKDLKGKDVCFIDPASATGYLFPAAAFLDAGIDPETDINPLFIGDHTSAVQAMAAGECAAAFTHGTNLEYIANPDKFTKIFDQVVPSPGFSVSTKLPDDVRKKVTDAVLKINGDLALERDVCPADMTFEDEEHGVYCHAVDVFWGAVPEDDSYWEPLRAVCEKTRAPACEA